MHIHSIEFSNIFAFGNKVTRVDYDNLGDGSLNMIIGKNGCGKSSFIKLHKLALYFESDGVTVNGISNDINGNGYVAIEVTSNGHRWKIASHYTRTKLNTLEVFKDGSETAEDWGKIPDTKTMINQQIIDIPYHIFSNILSLSINDFKSFLSMNPKDTRNIRDRIFGFYVLNDMMENLKTNMKSYNDRYTEINNKVASLNEIIEETNQKIANEQQQLSLHSDAEKADLQLRIEECQKQIRHNKKELSDLEQSQQQYKLLTSYYKDQETLSLIDSLNANISDIRTSLASMKEKYDSGYTEIKDMESDLRTYELKSNLEVYENIVSKIQQQQQQLNKIETDLASSNDSVNQLEAKLRNIDLVKQYNSVVEFIFSKISSIKTIHAELNEVTKSLDTKEEASREIKDSIQQHETEIKTARETIANLEKENSLYSQKKCPTCGNNFESAEFQQKIVSNEIEIGRLKEIVEKRSEVVEKLTNDVNDIDVDIKKLTEHKTSLTYKRNLEKSAINDTITSFNEPVIVSSAQYQAFNEFYHNLLLLNDNDICGLSIEIDSYVITSMNDVNVQQSYDEQLEQNKKLNEEKISLSAKITSDKATLSQYDSNIIATAKNAVYKLQSLTANIIGDYKNQYNDKTVEVNEIARSIKDKETEINNISSQIETLRNGVSTVEYYKSRILPEIFNTNKEEVDGIITDIDQKISDINSNLQEYNDTLITLNGKLASIIEVSKSKLNQLEQLLAEYKQKSEDLNKEERKVLVNINFLKIIEYTLSDEGIKSYIIKELVPSINKNIGEILSQLEIPLIVKFDDEFKPTIYRFGEPVSINSISTGQTKMIDSAITFTITRLLLSKCNGINVVFYDEIFSSLHSSAITTMMEIISNEMVKQLGLHVFLVNHSYISSSFFDNIFEFYFKDNFSNIDIQTVEEYNKKLL